MDIDSVDDNRYKSKLNAQIVHDLKFLFIISSNVKEQNMDDVRSVIKLAKINEKNLTDVSQVLYYGVVKEESDNIRLLELNDHLLATINKGQLIQFKGKLSAQIARRE